MTIMRTVYATLILLLGGAIGAVIVAVMWRQSERAKPVESVQVDILSAEEVAADLQRRKALARLPQASRKESVDQPNPVLAVSDSPDQFIIQPGKIYDVRYLPGAQFLIRADLGKVLFLIDDGTAFCVETYAKVRPQRKLQVSTCDNREARMTAHAKVETTAGAKGEATRN